MQKIQSAFKRYNINSKGDRTGDCVKRALALAYSMDYNDVGKELNAIKRRLNYSQFNVTPVFSTFMGERGDHLQKYDPPVDPETGKKKAKVKDFCESHPTGTYILLTGSDSNYVRGVSTHMCAVVNGDLYDSWDSYDWNVTKYAEISSGSDVFYETQYTDIEDELFRRISEWTQTKYIKKYPYIRSISIENDLPDNKYTGELVVRFRFDGNKLPEGAKEDYADKCVTRRFKYTVNIRLSPEQNIEVLTKKLCQRIYDQYYFVLKDIKDLERMRGAQINPGYYGSKTKLSVLPEWSWPYVIDFNDHYSSGWYDDPDRYYVLSDPLPDDPRTSLVEFHSETLKELRGNMERYKESYAREGYDY